MHAYQIILCTYETYHHEGWTDFIRNINNKRTSRRSCSLGLISSDLMYSPGIGVWISVFHILYSPCPKPPALTKIFYLCLSNIIEFWFQNLYCVPLLSNVNFNLHRKYRIVPKNAETIRIYFEYIYIYK